VNKAIQEIQELALQSQTSGKDISIDWLNKTLDKPKHKKLTFFEYAAIQIQLMNEAGRIGNAITYKNAISKLRSYTKKEIAFSEIDFKLLDQFTSYMVSNGTKLTTVGIYMRSIRAIFNKAIKEDIIGSSLYPFTKYRIKTAKTAYRTLSIEQLKSIISLDLEPNTPIWNARNRFLLSFCLIGINFTDMFLLQSSNIYGDRIIYNRAKTKKLYSIKLTSKAQEILQLYANSNNDYLLPTFHGNPSPETIKKVGLQAIKLTNEYLGRIAKMAKIDQNITTYYARYSWANIAKSLGYSKDLIAEALGHEYGNKVTGIYLEGYGNHIIDEANEAVQRAVFS
jgi:integrase